MPQKHLWIKITQMPVEIRILSNGEHQIIESSTHIEAADEDAQYGCGICNMSLHEAENVDELCPGKGNEDLIQRMYEEDQD